MVLVLAMMIGIVVGFIFGMVAVPFCNAEKKTTASAIKVIILLAVIVGGCVFCLLKDWSYLLSFGLGVIVGVSPYATNLKKNNDEEGNGNESETGNQ